MPRRHTGGEESPTRTLLIEAAEAIMIRDGCAAVTARSLATAIGLKRQIIHYYFASIDDLLVQVIRRRAGVVRDEIEKAFSENDPFEAIWRVNGSPAVSATNYELNALALRNETVREEVRAQMSDLYELQRLALLRYCEREGVEPSTPLDVLVTMIAGTSQVAAVEAELGLNHHANGGDGIKAAMHGAFELAIRGVPNPARP